MIQGNALMIPAVLPCLGGEAHMMMEGKLGAHMDMALNIARGNGGFNLPLRMRFAEFFAKAYNFPLSVQGGEADAAAQGAFFRQFADGIRPHFSTAVKYAANHDVVNLFNAHGLSDVNFPDLVAAGLVTAEAAKALEDSVADSAQRVVDSGVHVLGKAASWFSPSRVIPRIGMYGGIFAGLYMLAPLIDASGNPVAVAGWITFLAVLGIELTGMSQSNDIYGKHKENCTASLAALAGARKAFGIKTDEPENGPKVVKVG